MNSECDFFLVGKRALLVKDEVEERPFLHGAQQVVGVLEPSHQDGSGNNLLKNNANVNDIKTDESEDRRNGVMLMFLSRKFEKRDNVSSCRQCVKDFVYSTHNIDPSTSKVSFRKGSKFLKL